MVEGLERFKAHFANHTDQYVLIGGGACTIAMESVGQSFRATKDLDIVLCVEVLSADFVRAFWRFVHSGQYEIQQKATGGWQFYRFQKPAVDGYPFMLELFSRAPDELTPAPGSHLTPIPMDEGISSLSAILLDSVYYEFLLSGKRVLDGVQIVGAEHLIPLKARAWIDLSDRRRRGEEVDAKTIRKHKNDVLRLFAIVDPSFSGPVPDQVRIDLATFLERIKGEAIDLNRMGLGNRTLKSIIEEIREIYGLD